MKARKMLFVMVFLGLISSMVLGTCVAAHLNRSQNHGNKQTQAVTNPIYKETCGACHFTYQPELLPSGSWRKVMAGVGEHFGQTLEMNPETRREIESYLAASASEYSSGKRARKIMKSLHGETPLRVTEIPYIKATHHEISPATLKRTSIGSLSNCIACHTLAQDGIYDDDTVVIPE